MKRILAALVAAAILIPSAASAEPQWRVEALDWAKSLATGAANGIMVPDSGISCGSAARTDTSMAFSMGKIARPDHRISAVDTVIAFAVYVTPLPSATSIGGTTTAPTVAADSIYLDTQVSMNGVDWITVTPTNVFFTGGAAGTGGPNQGGAVVLEISSNNSFYWPYLANSTASQVANTAPNDYQLFGWPLVRFLVGHENDGCYSIATGFWSTAATPNN